MIQQNKFKSTQLNTIVEDLQAIGCLDILETTGVKLPVDLALDAIITQDKEMINLKDKAKKLSKSNLNILITGETGVGKELFARVLHGNRKGKFVCVNCGGIPDTLIESEFFGSSQGAFTGAKNRIGYFEEAIDGTLFLDEIGELDRSLQSKLLRVIQEKTVRRLGDMRERPINCRIVSATNHEVDDLKNHPKFFRQDLYYRLAGSIIHIKPLRQRGEDAQLIADMILKTNGFLLPKSDDKSDWPGNVRELLNYIEEWKALN